MDLTCPSKKGWTFIRDQLKKNQNIDVYTLIYCFSHILNVKHHLDTTKTQSSSKETHTMICNRAIVSVQKTKW